MGFSNVYDDQRRAEAYASLEFTGTYYLAYRDLPAIITQHVAGRVALDFGCGAGRSTRFLRKLGFDATGIDISSSMIQVARQADPEGRYLLIADGDFSALEAQRFDLILSAFAFDNIPGLRRRRTLMSGLRRLLHDDGRIVLLASTPEIYRHEWTTFTTKAYPENCDARSGDPVKIVTTAGTDPRPVVDILWTHKDYLWLFAESQLDMIAHHTPLGRDGEPYTWVTEKTIAPWVIYVVRARLPQTVRIRSRSRSASDTH